MKEIWKKHFSDWKTPLKAVLIFLVLVFIMEAVLRTGENDERTPGTTFIAPMGGTVALEARSFQQRLGKDKVSLYGYGGLVPGPTFVVGQDSEMTVDFTNNLEEETTIHWHGVRVENQFDGVPGVTQEPVQPGETFTYQLRFPDPGIYWYHPHVREDRQQDLGLYGNIVVQPKQEAYFGPVNEEVLLVLDDILLENGKIVPHGTEHATHALMGRFGNVMLVNGQIDYKLEVQTGEVVRFYLTNVANTRTFQFFIEGMPMKLVGSDVGRYEQERMVDSIIIAPAERYIIEVLFDKPGEYILWHRNPLKQYALGKITVKEEPAEESFRQHFLESETAGEMLALREQYAPSFEKEPDHKITLTVAMPSEMMQHAGHSTAGMEGETEGGIEWEDTMPMMNAMSTSENTRWILRDEETGKENMDIDWKFKVGDLVKIRIFNDPDSMHPMQHPMHFHGQRFLVLAQDGKRNDNLVWKDTVLVPAGSYVDILLEISNPGKWMAHCHIAEHLTSGMMLMFEVEA